MSTPATPAPGRTAADAATADAIAAAVAACPAVVSLAGGGPGLIATYLPGRRVDGVRLAPDRVAVSVVGLEGIPVAVLADQVRAAVGPLAPGLPVDVHVADTAPLTEQPPALPPGPPA